jgi:hypothetical protein
MTAIDRENLRRVADVALKHVDGGRVDNASIPIRADFAIALLDRLEALEAVAEVAKRGAKIDWNEWAQVRNELWDALSRLDGGKE